MIKYDKLKNLNVDECVFNFTCFKCKSNGLKKGMWTMLPIGISYKPDGVDNSDIKNDLLRISYNRLPTLRQALLEACSKSEPNKLLIFCNTCKMPIDLEEKITLSHMRKWIRKNLGEYLDLRADKIGTRK